MKLLSRFIFCLILAFSGCRQETISAQPKEKNSMIIDNIEIQSSIEKSPNPFSFQADIVLKITVQNLADTPKTIPFISTHGATFILKNKKTGISKNIFNEPPTVPMVPPPEKHPEYILESKATVPFRIYLQHIFGVIKAGEYSLQYQIESPWFNYTTPLIEFSVLPQAVGSYAITPSSNNKAQRHILVWSDLASTPNRIMFQRLFTGAEKPLMPSTFAIAETDSPSTPISITSFTEQYDNFEWVGWLSKNNLCLTKIYSNDTIQNISIPIPPKFNWSLLPALNYANNVEGKNTQLSGMLLGKDDSGASLTAFLLREDLKPKWLPLYRLPPGKILAAKVLPLSEQSHFVIWIRSTEGKLIVEGVEWNDSLGFNKSILKCGMLNESEQTFRNLDAVVNSTTIKWGVLLIKDNEPEKPAHIQTIVHHILFKEYKTGTGAPKLTSLVGQVGPQSGMIRFDANELTWLLIHDVHGLWVKNNLLKEFFPIDCPRGFKNEELYFKNGVTPKILFLNPETGFESLGITLPDFEEPDESDLQ